MSRFAASYLVLVSAAAAPAGAQERTWSERFPALARRVPYLDRRLAADEVVIRKRVVTELTYFRPRDSKVYPPFLRALLKDPSPEIRGEAVERLWEHHVFLALGELPSSFHVHAVGEFRWKEPAEVARVRELARRRDEPAGGWATHALALVGDKGAVPLARAQLDSTNVFVRYSSALALVQLGHAKEGAAALHRITDAGDDETGYYRCRAAETLVRLGDGQALDVLIALMEGKGRESYADGPREILEDLTGQYFLTAAEARAWRKTNAEPGAAPDRRGR